MSAVWTVAAREVRARQMLLIAAVVVAALPFVVGVAYGPGPQETVALLLCTSFPFAVAVGTGAAMLSREIGERRLGFYFSRPIGAGSLWAGKVIGAVGVVVATFACMLVPILASVPTRHVSPDSELSRILGIAFLVLLSVFVMAVAHTGTSMFRARSPWFVADIVLAAACATACVLVVRGLMEAGAFLPALRLGPALPIIFGLFLLALLGGTFAQLAVGRTDARRGHFALSATVWISLVAIVAGFATWQRWVLGGTPGHAGGVGYPLLVSSAGDGIFFRGLTGRAGFVPFYLMDAATGAFLRISPDSEPMPTFSADGRTAAWVSIPEPWEGDHRRRLWVARLGEDVRLATREPLEGSARWNTVLALHADGRQAVIGGFGEVGVVDLQTASVGATLALRQVLAADVLADGRVRLFHAAAYGAAGPALAVSTWSPRDGSLDETLRVPGAALLTRRGDTAAVSVGQRDKAIVDLAAARVHRVAGDAVDPLPHAIVLGDGRVALSMGTEVRIVAAGGATLVVPLPPDGQASALREAEPGRLAIGMWSRILSRKRTLFVDTATGTIVREEPGLLPAGGQTGLLAQAEPGSLSSRLFTDEEGNLVALEPGERRRIILASSAEGR